MRTLDDAMARETNRSLDTHHLYLTTMRQALAGYAAGLNLDASPPPPAPPRAPVLAPTPPLSRVKPLWDRAAIEEFVSTSASSLLGPSYAALDAYPIRCRPPSPPFLFVDRVTRMTAQRDAIGPCIIEWEYDIQPDAWFLMGRQLSPIILLESSHTVTLLLAVMGLDLRLQGEGRFRILSSVLSLDSDLPGPGETFRGVAEITSIFETPGRYLIKLNYEGYIGNRRIFSCQPKCGFFRETSLESGNATPAVRPKPRLVPEVRSFPTACKPTTQSALTAEAITALNAGQVQTALGIPSADLPPGPHLFPDKLRLLHRITQLSYAEGASGLGRVTGEWDIPNAFWVFDAHFKNDPVLPGLLNIEGSYQTLLCYLFGLNLGPQLTRFKPSVGVPSYSTFLGEVRPHRRTIRYEVSILDLVVTETAIRVLARSEVYCDDRLVGFYEGLSLEADRRPSPPPRLASAARRATHFVGDVGALRTLDQGFFLVRQGEAVALAAQAPSIVENIVSQLPPFSAEDLGSREFCETYGTRIALMAGSMANNLSNTRLVHRMMQGGMLASLSSGGVPLEEIERSIRELQRAFPERPVCVNLIHTPREPLREDQLVDLFFQTNLHLVEASAYIRLTPAIVRYRVKGLYKDAQGIVRARNRVIAKFSRPEVAKQFLNPPPAATVARLLEAGKITATEAALAPFIAMADDITIEADSGGHTDRQPLSVIFPQIQSIVRAHEAATTSPTPMRIGAAGGIGTPQAALAAFAMGADYVVTGSINQASVEAGTSNLVKGQLALAQPSDREMGMSSDMFELGIKVQILSMGSRYPMKSMRLYELYKNYDGWASLPPADQADIETNYFRDSFAAIWQDTTEFFERHDPAQITRAREDPKHQLALVFRWYLGKSSRWARQGIEDRRQDFQIWCGPAMGAFNHWVKGTALEPLAHRHVDVINRTLMEACAYHHRVQHALGFCAYKTAIDIPHFLKQPA